MLSCKEVVEILSSETGGIDPHRQFSWMKRAGLRLHLMACRHCARYARQLRVLGDGARRLFERQGLDSAEKIERLERQVIEKVKKPD